MSGSAMLRRFTVYLRLDVPEERELAEHLLGLPSRRRSSYIRDMLLRLWRERGEARRRRARMIETGSGGAPPPGAPPINLDGLM